MPLVEYSYRTETIQYSPDIPFIEYSDGRKLYGPTSFEQCVATMAVTVIIYKSPWAVIAVKNIGDIPAGGDGYAVFDRLYRECWYFLIQNHSHTPYLRPKWWHYWAWWNDKSPQLFTGYPDPRKSKYRDLPTIK